MYYYWELFAKEQEDAARMKRKPQKWKGKIHININTIMRMDKMKKKKRLSMTLSKEIVKESPC